MLKRKREARLDLYMLSHAFVDEEGKLKLSDKFDFNFANLL